MAHSPERWLARAYHGLCRQDHERLVISYEQLFERLVTAHDQHRQAVALRGEGAKVEFFPDHEMHDQLRAAVASVSHSQVM
jgi:hypothetical protein